MICIILLFITASLSKQCSEFEQYKYIIDTVDSAFECIESIQTTEGANNAIINDLKYYLESYVFKDILKNPPQPSFSNNYYEKVDIDSKLDKINTKTTSLYEFYSEINNLIISTRDSHLAFSIKNKNYFSINKNSELTLFSYFLPFTINIDNDKKMYLIPRHFFKSRYVKPPKEIEKNEYEPVKTINGEDPFNIIPKDYFVEGGLSYLPLTKEYLNTPISITWENGESVSVNYKIYRETASVSNSNEKLKQGIRKPLTEEETKDIINTKKALDENDRITRKFTSKDNNIHCTLSVNGVNTLVVRSFDTKDEKSYEETISNCIDLFDSNNYPIQVIFPKNGGGYSIYSQWIEKILSPYDDVNYIVSLRESDYTKHMLKTGFAVNLYDPKTCQQRRSKWTSIIPIINSFPLGGWYSKPNIIKYGDVEHKVTQPSIEVFPKKKLMKHPRKPTEIVVYTDSYCYSGCSLVTKGLKEWGGAILLGFDGDPYGKDEEFEVGLSPTAVIESVPVLSHIWMGVYGYNLRISFGEKYRYNYEYNETIPREFLTDMIDERVNIYQFSNYKINEFAEETKKIVEKYQTKCNPKNKRLVKRDSICDNEINIEHGHGGYECGDNGEWSSKCVLAYCDSGYKFDYINNKCIKGICSSGMPIMTVNLVMIILGIITLIL
ncbi:hypothetical protein CL6EHI_145160 [Entamoeba histolytica]|uniref:Uncharacterized protein n=2 Tax=Entamoeba histolytica TaxID=5759 RepID=B1N555_ENTH1|nr:hypothetical protein EHI_145160 [Entamoeba histolytica HM-1:IMSS]EDS88903.1 hypothetical protein EHI_145160 [Entamoeba histolytica HM-1:IMSS]GAT99227.1 hypothetical protein CL6EHI_145160 [Entamoeba histolytica]|eukprot:XP_001914321.1 hypothetical protein EHI_145160 [Entamoeba histolytica HM-1:IMSS]